MKMSSDYLEYWVNELLSINNSQEFLKRVSTLNPKYSDIISDDRVIDRTMKHLRELCRECKHQRLSHRNTGDPTIDIACKYEGCFCQKFIPENNLEFLEMKAQEKHA
jgi:hypothetical protein